MPASRLRFNSDLTLKNNNVGIGTADPTSKLTVVGTVNATSFVGNGSQLTGVVSQNQSIAFAVALS